MTEKKEPSARDPLSEIKGDVTLNSVWERVLKGEATQRDRAKMIEHYREKRKQFLSKEAKKDEQ